MKLIYSDFLEALTEHEAYRVCRLLTMDQFIKFCSERGISIHKERLLRFEELGIFYPILRIYKPDIQIKVEYVEGGRRYRDLGQLKEGELWEGDLRDEIAQFSFASRYVQSWKAEGFVWNPKCSKNPHMESITSEPRRHEAYFSRFQIFHLASLVNSWTCSVSIEGYLEAEDATKGRKTLQEQLAEAAKAYLEIETKDENYRGIAAYIAQFISDRYFPQTQTDERRITTSSGDLDFPDWGWHQYARGWNPQIVHTVFELDKESLGRTYRALCTELKHADPLVRWANLVRFVKVNKRKELKGKALYAQTVLAMAAMLRRLHKDLYEEELEEPYEVYTQIFNRVPDILPSDDPLTSLGLVMNDFGLNPQPNLVLFLEGKTEYEIVPLIIDKLFGASPSVFGIEILNFKGINNVTGGRKDTYSALCRQIDYLHHHQIICMVIADNEGENIRNLERLPKAHSIHSDDRYVTRKEYIKIWKRSFEFDNFSNKEIAATLAALGGKPFTQKEVAACRKEASSPVPKKGAKKRTLATLYEEKTGRGLDKLKHAELLVEEMFKDTSEKSYEERPICKFLIKVAERASRNHKPITQSSWEYNQKTGYLGTLKPGVALKRKKPFR